MGRRIRRADAAYNVTVPEGWHCEDIGTYVAERLAAAGFGDVAGGPVLLTGVGQRHARGARCRPVTPSRRRGSRTPRRSRSTRGRRVTGRPRTRGRHGQRLRRHGPRARRRGAREPGLRGDGGEDGDVAGRDGVHGHHDGRRRRRLRPVGRTGTVLRERDQGRRRGAGGRCERRSPRASSRVTATRP